MVFVGDPFTFGAGLNDSETLAAFLCKTYKVSSVNLGISNYSTNHSLFPMQEFHNERPRSERESFCGQYTYIYPYIPNHTNRALGRAPWVQGGLCYRLAAACASQKIILKDINEICNIAEDISSPLSIIEKLCIRPAISGEAIAERWSQLIRIVALSPSQLEADTFSY